MALTFSMTAPPSPAWYVGGLMAFLVAHEAGHWTAARQRGLQPRWPIFLPWPLQLAAWLGWSWLPAFGTLGALVPMRIHADPDTRWSVAVAGLLSGLLAAVALCLYGALLSVPATGIHVWSRLPEPWLVRALVPSGLRWHPLLIAGWIGIAVTGVNMLPLPFLDGWLLWPRVNELTPRLRWCSLALAPLCLSCLPL